MRPAEARSSRLLDARLAGHPVVRVFVLVFAALVGAGCEGEGAGDASASSPAVERVDERVGPIRSASLSVTPGEGTAADAFTVRVRASVDAGAEAVAPEGEGGWADAIGLPGAWRVLGDGFVATTESTADGLELRVEGRAAPPPGSGTYEIGPATLVARDATGEEATLSLGAVGVTVRSNLPEGHAGAYDPDQGELDPPVRVPWWWITAGALALAGVIVAIVLGVRALVARATRPRRVPPHVRTLGELDRLAGSFGTTADWAGAVTRLSEIARSYVEHRYDIRAPERTTEEFLREAASTGFIEAGDRERLGAFLNQCDLVKFAQHRAQGDEVRAAAADIRAFVERSGTDRVVLLIDRRGRVVGREERAA